MWLLKKYILTYYGCTSHTYPYVVLDKIDKLCNSAICELFVNVAFFPSGENILTIYVRIYIRWLTVSKLQNHNIVIYKCYNEF